MSAFHLLPDDIVQDIRLQLHNIGEHSLIDMIGMMRKYGTGDRLTKIEVMNALTKAGVFLTLVQLTTLVRAFDVEGEGFLSLAAFTKAIKGEYSKRRLCMLKRVFQKIDKNGNGKIEYKEMIAKFNPHKHPSVKASLLSPEVVEDRMKVVFEGAQEKGYLTFEQFAEYYKNMSAAIPHNDELFCEIMCGVWSVNENEEKKFITQDDPRVQKMLEFIRSKVFQKSDSSTGNYVPRLNKTFKFFDTNMSGNICLKEWGDALDRLGVNADKNTSRLTFECFAKDGSIDYRRFSAALLKSQYPISLGLIS
ncbi:hypothetical protein AAMO2058_000620100 [Amorphochlora amoebiformis]|uniref:EF-hand domain-containing protein n=1 Tax=Amorphochlora amoebiformis TaxID=1561963 RepID=A0A7S0H4I2_9EUKA|mmetsp:Transcript_33647/g.54177  ORF Transcript_33647/g.54177 Transcript_33647/m.54177 type:complete len:306 (+) Transcript_33647:381-1298(+)